MAETDRRSNDNLLTELAVIKNMIDMVKENFDQKFNDSDRIVQNQLQHLDTIIKHVIDGQEANTKTLLDRFTQIFDSHARHNEVIEKSLADEIAATKKKLELYIETNDKRVLDIEEAPAKKSFEFNKSLKGILFTSVISLVFGALLVIVTKAL